VTALHLETVGRLAPRIERGEASSTELVRAVLDQAERHESLLQAFITLRPGEAMAAAKACDREIAAGRYRGPLHGIPIAIKDNLAVAGWPTTNGSRAWARHVTDFDATVVARLRAAGAVILGKTALHEWGMGGTCSGMFFGTVRNPWDPDRVPGGSSGGSAVAVSAGLALAALGTDGMGSVRTPAAYCGVVGLKPTHGLVSRFGDLPPTSSWLHDVGTLARDVTDAGILLDAIAGPDPSDPSSVAPPDGWRVRPAPEPNAAGLRIGRLRGWFEADALPQVVAAVDAAARALEAAGAVVEEAEFEAASDVGLALTGLTTEAHAVLLEIALNDPTAFAGPETRYRILAAEFVRGVDVRRGLQLRNRIRVAAKRLMESFDLLLLASNSTPAFPIGSQQVVVGPQRELVDLRRPGGQGRITTRLSTPFNLTGQPAISLPASVPDGVMPIGIGLVGRRWGEPVLLRAARALEAGTTGGYRPPPLADPTRKPGASAIAGGQR
jgi:aspartyl-tRNA(Asn)/glutamyl-tRNA(Gln) amidotransferase subunit A